MFGQEGIEKQYEFVFRWELSFANHGIDLINEYLIRCQQSIDTGQHPLRFEDSISQSIALLIYQPFQFVGRQITLQRSPS